MATSRKVFQIIVDETAFTTNISEIKKWLTHGAITVYVPLYTLECLRILKKEHNQLGTNAREAVRFLDRVTSGKDNTPIDKVVVEGPLDQYASWAEVMEQLLPEFQQDAEPGHEDDSPSLKPVNGNDIGTDGPLALSQELLAKLNFKAEPVSLDHSTNGSSSVGSAQASANISSNSDKSPSKSVAKITTSGPIPKNFRPFLNAASWRVAHQPVTTSCVLLTNNPECRDWAQMFGIPVKNIQQLRTAITYEDKESRNQNKYLEKNLNPAPSTEPKTMLNYENAAHGSDDEEVIFVPRGRDKGTKTNGSGNGTSSNGGIPRANGRRAAAAPASSTRSPDVVTPVDLPSEPIDPNSFSRNIGPTVSSSASPAQLNNSSQPGSGRGLAPVPRGLFNANTGRANRESSGRGGGRNGHHGSRRDRENGHGANARDSNGNGAGGSHHRGSSGVRGSSRGKGTLFVP